MLSKDFIENVLDSKSKPIYEFWYNKFNDFREKNEKTLNISTILDFFLEIKHYYKLSSLWQCASCLNKYLKYKENFEFIKNDIFKSFMKKEAKDPNNITKKSSTLTIENVQDFLRNSEDSFSNLVVKVGIIVGVYGGMRISEIIALNFEDVKYDQGKYKVSIKCSH